MYNNVSSMKKDSLTSSFPMWISFVSSSCLIAMARTSSTVLNNSGESEHNCLVPNLKRNTCSFCSLNMMLAVGFTYMAFIMLRYVPSIPTLLRVFIINGYWISSNAISASIYMIKWFFFFFFLCGVSHLLIFRNYTNLISPEYIPLNHGD